MDNLIDRVAALPAAKRDVLLHRLRDRPGQPAVVSPPGECVVRGRPDDEALFRLFCFPYAGGGAAAFRGWGDALPREVEVCAVRFPGRESRIGEPAHRRMAALIDDLGPSIAPLLDRPFAFYGHSMGALVAFELTRWLRATCGASPSRLFLAAFRAPQLPNPHIKIYHLPDEVLKAVLRTDGTPQRILDNDELMKAMLPTLRADFELCDTYRYETDKPLDCPLTIFAGQDDERVNPSDLDGWMTHTSSAYRFVMVPGGHFFLHSAQSTLIDSISLDLQWEWTLGRGVSHA
jgi:surfactin synthase thioesterase subunit